jgi:DNA-binding NarL/FixJ family response regulator
LLQAELESVVLARFESGRVALDELAANNYDIAILNLVTVGSQPVLVISELLSEHPNIRIIVATAPETVWRVRSQLIDLDPTRLALIESPENVMPEAIMGAVKSLNQPGLAGELSAADSLEAELVG